MSFIENKDILFIINPYSGNRRAEKLVKKINAFDTEIAIIITRNLVDLDKTFKENIEKYKLFILVGGDGTVNEAIKYLLGRNDKILAVFPAGSGNGFAKEMGYKPSLQALIQAIKNPEVVNIDVLVINHEFCINVAGMGFDSFVAHQFHRQKGRGLKNYIIASIKSMFTFRAFEATIIADGLKIAEKYQMITFANTRHFGNNAFISPQSKPDDGIFELVLVKPFPFYIYPVFISRLFTNTLKASKYIDYIPVKNYVEVISPFNNYHIDGEPKLLSGKLKVNFSEFKISFLKV